jgi:hypothetical protein
MPQASEILGRVIAATRANKLSWEPVGRDSFRTQVGNMYITISNNNNDSWTFSIYDDEGRILESSSGSYLTIEYELYESARRGALKVDEALEYLDQKLKDLL